MTEVQTQETQITENSVAKTRRDLQQQVTDNIVSQLEKGVVPWNKPWQSNGVSIFSLPKNAVTGKSYRGVNILLLWSAIAEKQFPTNEWASFKQWQSKNEIIRKGEKGTLIIYTDTFEKEVDGEIEKIPFLKHSIVFNKSQLNSFVPSEPKPKENHEYLEQWYQMDDLIRQSGAVIEHGSPDAYYDLSTDKIHLPNPEDFTSTPECSSTELYFGTACHELTHWTGAKHRLNRSLVGNMGSQSYAQEELVAELGAAFLCAEHEISVWKENTASYIGGWLKVLKNNKQFIFQAARDASKAVDYLKTLHLSK